MRCPFCGVEEQRVLDSRPAREGGAIRRRRECAGCGRRFTTFEAPELPRLFLVKRDGLRESFDREKLLRGLVTACRKRPVAVSQLERVVECIEQRLVDRGDSEVSSECVGHMALEALRELDSVAFVRFASVYERFETPEDFQRLLAKNALLTPVM